jgi:hypothetical protein
MSEEATVEITQDNHRYGLSYEQSGCGQFAFNMSMLAVISMVAIGLLWVTG